ncbi:hypothetical protein MS2017_2039 [Bathymodiolus thermophilus thioautotrophic gill symbiont]|uniref:IrrE N-terminal-like domain-containing protein n=1 Tax=Bathymodiolus thermophilus thioautotrophic gill symbiont TaxID=2360 RepID=A0A3G3IPE7_9GAMM|nr:ImmA/IrrE family metallo-endopeptidase [Bathymodiolus thermophilus thioautotrophic gill symbiont]AYQ57697.1 hypothetical protein MS2017_2039 [Bathymodiolus thermophilus thioautotrophic gill symbiont]CAB5496911.1 hypothetical protein THERMOS_587 [Bathymodiolus thermophilus thioautotrophic gill symbiont]
MTTHQQLFDSVIKNYNGQYPTPVAQIAAELGITVASNNFNDQDKYGELSKSEAGKYAITYNSESDALRQRHTIAHEIGHFVLHEEYFKDHNAITDMKLHFRNGGYTESDLIQEEQANNFAIELLVPKNSVFTMLVEGKSIEEIADIFVVTESTVNLSIGWEVGLEW